MQIANCNVILNEFKSTVPKKNITPAEAMLLIHMHKSNAGETPVVALQIQKDAAKSLDNPKQDRTANEELARLRGIYRNKSDDKKIVTITSVFPSAASVPQKFSDIVDENGATVFSDDGRVLVDGKTKESDTVTIGGSTMDKGEIAKGLAELARLKQLEADFNAKQAKVETQSNELDDVVESHKGEVKKHQEEVKRHQATLLEHKAELDAANAELAELRKLKAQSDAAKKEAAPAGKK